ncbi:MAG: hypothetical protein ACRCRP_00035 [Metamycoplasmataceae bacterium]
MVKKLVLGTCLATGIVSAGAITTVLVLNPMKKNFINSRNLKITSYSGIINISQVNLDAMISVSNSLEERISALSKLFEGVNEKNINNFTIEEASDSSIILIAKDDYFFEHKNIKSITGNYKINKIINVSAKEGVIGISQDDINLIFSQVSSIADKVVALSKLFDGITEENFVNFKIEKTSDTTITLKANTDYVFGIDALVSLKVDIKIDSILNITPKDGIINVTNEDILAMISVQNTPEKIIALSKLFDGIDEKNIINVVAEKTSNTVITLKALNGYTFGSTTITSITTNIKIITILNIKPKTIINNVTNSEVQEMISTSNTPSQKAKALSKLFDGVNELNVNNFTSIKTSETIITLTAKNGYVFGAERTDSIKATIQLVNILNITPKDGIINVTNENILAMISVQNTPEKIIALSKLFDGITEQNVINIIAEKTSDKLITLKANKGFSFNNSTTLSITVNINIVTIINITAKKVITNVTEADINAMISTTNSLKERIDALSKLFDGITEGNINNFTVERQSPKIIVLKANSGFVFGEALVSSIGANIDKVIEILNITPKPGTINIIQKDLDEINSNIAKVRVEALSKLFNGVTEGNLNNFKIVKNPSSVTLTANDGFALGFITTTSITTNFKIITILNIIPKEGIINVTTTDIIDMFTLSNVDKRVAALSKIFNGINRDNSSHVRAENTSDTEITLNSNDGFSFGVIGNNSIKANIKIITILNISPKSKVIDVTDKDISEMVSSTNSPQQRLESLSKLFDGININNVANVAAVKTSNTIISLNVVGNYIFDYNSSSTITAKIRIISILNITPKSNINIVQEDINEMISTTNSVAIRVKALSKIFDGITEKNVINFKVIQTSNTEITLNSNEGFSFGVIGNNSIKANIKLITILNITQIINVNNVTQEDINAMISTTNSLKERAASLSKLFNGVTEGNVTNFIVSKTSETIITLTAKDGFAFGSMNNFSVQSFFRLVKILNITPKEGINRISEADYNIIWYSNNPDAKVASLAMLFNGVSGYDITENRYSIKAENNVLTLTANLGYIFGSTYKPSVQSSFKVIKILNIKPKPGTIGINQTEMFILESGPQSSIPEKINILNKLFDGGINAGNFNNHFTLLPLTESKVVLVAKDGYAFGSINITSIETKIVIDVSKYINITYDDKFKHKKEINQKK